MSVKKPPPPEVAQSGKVCPVCGDRSYSPSGTHPQCAQQKAETAHSDQIIAQRKKEEESQEKQQSTGRSWKKSCPKCRAEIHVRKKICPCGHAFASM
ncbi:MAG: hypothetical protein N2B57_08905 [Planctomycetales bacterium]